MQLKTTRGVQLEDVWAAADALIEQGDKPTIEKVRLKMGRGSPNTVGPMLDAWFATLGDRLKKNQMSSNDILPIQVQDAALKLWDAANAEAQNKAKNAYLFELEQLNLQKLELEAQRSELIQHELLTKEKLKLLENHLQQAQQINNDFAARIQLLEKNIHIEQDANKQLELQKQELQNKASVQRQQYDENLYKLQIERQQLTEQFANNEKRWLVELDRARQELQSSKKQALESERVFHQDKQAWLLELNLKNETLESTNAQLKQQKLNTVIAIRLTEEQKIELSKLKKNNVELQNKINEKKELSLIANEVNTVSAQKRVKIKKLKPLFNKFGSNPPFNSYNPKSSISKK